MVDRTFLSLLVAARVSDPWYDNSWLIGIATGLASGILLAMATPIVLRMRRARKRAVEGERCELAEEIHTPAHPHRPGQRPLVHHFTWVLATLTKPPVTFIRTITRRPRHGRTVLRIHRLTK